MLFNNNLSNRDPYLAPDRDTSSGKAGASIYPSYEKRKLTQEENDALRGRLIDIIASNADEAAILKDKYRLASEYRCSIVQLHGIHAQLTNRVFEILVKAEILTEDIFNAKTSQKRAVQKEWNSKVIFIASHFSMIDSPQKRRESFPYLSELLGISDQVVKKIYKAITELSENGDKVKSRSVATPKLTAEGRPTAVALKMLSPKQEKRVLAVSADNINYNFHSKNIWRERWGSFLDPFIASLDLRDQLVVCLPSKQCYYELAIYVHREIPSKCIIPVEGGSANSRREFRKNITLLRRSGEEWRDLKGLDSKLEKLLAPRTDPRSSKLNGTLAKHRFTIASLDFEGPVSKTNLPVLQLLALAPKACVLINVMGARERKDVQGALEHLLRLNHSASIENTSTVGVLGDAHSASDQTSLSLQDARASGLDYILLSNIGVARSENRRIHAPDLEVLSELIKANKRSSGISGNNGNGYYNSVVNPLELINAFNEDSAKIARALSDLLMGWHLQGRYVTRDEMNYLPSLCVDTCFGLGKVVRLQKWLYHSEVSKTSTPYWSTFAEIDTPLEHYKHWDQSATFIRSVIRALYENPNRQAEFIVTDSYYNPRSLRVATTDALKVSDRLCLVIDGRPLNNISISIAKLLDDLSSYKEWIKRYPLDNFKAQASLERNEIS